MLDYDQLEPVIAEVMLQVMEHRKRQAREETYRQNRTTVALHYNRLRSKKPPLILPTLPIFRQLPIVAMVQSSDPATEIEPSRNVFKDTPWVQQRLEVELKQWVDQAKQALGAVLGHPMWKTASATKLHPADRITARFLCKYCERLAARFRDDECLDLYGACTHECRTEKHQRHRDQTWDAARFVRDDKVLPSLI